MANSRRDTVESPTQQYDFDNLACDIVPPKAEKLYDLLISIKMTPYFQEFLDEDFDDEVILMVNPQNSAFISQISKVLKKGGAVLKFQNAVERFQFQQSGKSVERNKTQKTEIEESKKSSEDEDEEETESQYASFNIYEVSIRFYKM